MSTITGANEPWIPIWNVRCKVDLESQYTTQWRGVVHVMFLRKSEMADCSTDMDEVRHDRQSLREVDSAGTWMDDVEASVEVDPSANAEYRLCMKASMSCRIENGCDGSSIVNVICGQVKANTTYTSIYSSLVQSTRVYPDLSVRLQIAHIARYADK